MLLLNAFMAHVYQASFNILFDSHGIYYAPFVFILITVIVLWTIYVIIFKWAYPWVRARVLFGRMKNEMFYNRSWEGVSIDEFISILDEYLVWYNTKRIKMSLGGMSPLQYRQSLNISC
jgi:hypothetical protein